MPSPVVPTTIPLLLGGPLVLAFGVVLLGLAAVGAVTWGAAVVGLLSAVAAAALVGLVVAFLQAATQLQEQTFPYALKFLTIVIMLFVTGSLIGGTLYVFADRIFLDFPGLVRR